MNRAPTFRISFCVFYVPFDYAQDMLCGHSSFLRLRPSRAKFFAVKFLFSDHSPGGGRNTAKTLSEFVIHDSKNTVSSGLRLSSAIAPARQNQLSSS